MSISCPSCSATEGVVRNGKSTARHQRYLCSHCRKTWQLQFTYTASHPSTHQKIIAPFPLETQQSDPLARP
ncbi:IS1 family transposase, partial [Candidatus Erwinia dacicola]|uniref:IS1 family transposase n=1 Tax=Candidatus Erwinia dacicola TaxID=252393 RepID=UPI001392217E